MIYTLNIDINQYPRSDFSSKIDAINNYKMIELANDTKKNSYIEGQSFEKSESVPYSSITYIIEDLNGTKIKEYNSADGSFIIDGLVDNKPVNLIVIDTSKTYNGKYIQNIIPQIDLEKSMNIIRIYQTSDTALFKIKFNGDLGAVALFATNATVEKIDVENYKIKNITGSYTVTLHDYVDNILYTKEKTYN